MNPPRHAYGIAANMLKAGAITRHFISPTEAANLDPDAFLIFAAEVEKVARRLKAAPKPEQMSFLEDNPN